MSTAHSLTKVLQRLVRACTVFISHEQDFFMLFVCLVALRPKSTAMVIAGRSVHLTTLFPRQA